MTPEERDRLTRVETLVGTLLDDMHALVEEQKKTNEFLGEIRAGRKVLWKLLTFASAAGGIVGWLVDRFLGGH